MKRAICLALFVFGLVLPGALSAEEETRNAADPAAEQEGQESEEENGGHDAEDGSGDEAETFRVRPVPLKVRTELEGAVSARKSTELMLDPKSWLAMRPPRLSSMYISAPKIPHRR